MPIGIRLDGCIPCFGRLQISTGMIQLGYNFIPPFPKRKIVLHVNGTIIFKGKCLIGNESSIYVSGNLILGDNFSATYSLKLFCFDNITFGNNCLLAWDILCMDSSQHQLTDIYTNQHIGSKSKPIQIGENCWIASKCLILPGTKIANYTSVTANTTLHKDYLNYGTHKLIGDSPVRILKEDVYLKRK